jgi:hypothetical protein
MDGLPRVLNTQRGAFTVAAQQAAFAVLAFNPGQKRGPGGRWIKGGGGAPSLAGSPQRLSAREFEQQIPASRRFYRGVTNADAAEATRNGQLGGGD